MHHHGAPVGIVAFVLLLALAGCSSAQHPSAAKAQPGRAEPTYESRVVGTASPLDITGSVTTTLVARLRPAPGC